MNTAHAQWEHGVYPLLAAVSPDDDASTITVRYSDKQSQFAAVGSNNVPADWQSYEVKKVNVNNLLLKAHSNFPVSLMKIDCEGCEFWLLPRIHDTFFDKTLVLHVAGEFHLSVMDPLQAHAPETVSVSLADATKAVFKKRGCPTDSWIFDC